jgi:iron(III) transport system ATP-binding protein
MQIKCNGVGINYAGVSAVFDATFTVDSGEIVGLVGKSGCGKTSLIRAIAGFEPVVSGEIWIGGECMSSATRMTPPHRRPVGIVFQDPSLFAHMTVSENIAFGLHHLSSKHREASVMELLDFIGISEKASAYPYELSGGQQQRVALARALAPNPPILLLDEPFANLDPDTRDELCDTLKLRFKQQGTTVILISHHPEDIRKLADRCLTVSQGRVLF